MEAHEEKIHFYFEQEIGWIIANLSHGSNTVVHALVFDRSENHIEFSPTILKFLQRSLVSTKPAAVINALYFTANAMAESDTVC